MKDFTKNMNMGKQEKWGTGRMPHISMGSNMALLNMIKSSHYDMKQAH